MKDFDEFGGLSEEESRDLVRSVAEDVGLKSTGDGGYVVKLNDMVTFCADLSAQVTYSVLRKYHEWVNS